jgi:DNA-binding transcriptional LysR family regulator
MMFARVDPSALLALHVLLQERHVTRAGRRLGLSQSSMSHRLARLRAAFDDALFVRDGTTLIPTARAAAMAEPLAEALRALENATHTGTTFDPRRERFALRVLLPDLLAPVAPALGRALASHAPGLALELAPLAGDLDRELAAATPSVALGPAHFFRGSLVTTTVAELTFGVVGRQGHPALRRPLTLERWLAHPHVVVRVGNDADNPLTESLAALGLARRIGLVAPSYLAGLFALTDEDLLLNAPRPLVHLAAARLGLKVRDAPIALPSVRFVLAFHARHQRDPAHRWARDHLAAELRQKLGKVRHKG